MFVNSTVSNCSVQRYMVLFCSVGYDFVSSRMGNSSQSIDKLLSRDFSFFELQYTLGDLLKATSFAVNVMNGKFPASK